MIGQDVAAALPVLRAQAESLMRRTCTIERHDGSSWTVVHADAPCRLDVAPVTSRSTMTDELVTAETPVVKVPVTFAGVQPDDRVTLDDGSRAWVTHVPTYDDMVQIRIQCRWTR